MANSKLIKYTVLSPNHSGKRCYKLTRITPHCMVGQMTAQSCGNLFARSSYQASSNYGIGKDGEIGLYVDEDKRSWCTSSADNDNRAITIECASDAKHPYAMNGKVWDSLVRLCVDICRRYAKDTLLWLGDKGTSLKYKPKENELVLTAHRWFAAKSCPGDWLYKRLGTLAEKVTEQLQTAGAIAPAQKEEEKPAAEAASLINNEETDREKRIWTFLVSKGLNQYAAAGLMGNLYAESALRPNNLQNSFEKKLGMTDKGYTAAVNDGSYKKFADDKAGYGLAQWTWPTRKAGLLKYAQEKKKSIDDLDMQMDYLWKELQGYRRSMEALTAGKSIRAVSDTILTDFEKPADQSGKVKKRRAALGQEIYDRQTGAADKTEGGFAVQIGAFGSRKNAEKRAESLEAKELQVQVRKIGGFYKVQSADTYSTAAEAVKAQKDYTDKKIHTVVAEV